MNKTNKLSLNYEQTPHTVESNNNGDVELRNDETGGRIRRHVVHLKKSRVNGKLWTLTKLGTLKVMTWIYKVQRTKLHYS